ncbi:SDR family NAD(P)-dependent oxidoreductase [Subtercola endophyticus]|uniref:SDR family NAD(P)-dependent oxidoreductase n=1 Tax=Subtercola endophyticus TaxID=2895559 RepID=UPI001E60774F|nr:SDR family NAD(P)-dependent oxidoreductase [Subtercola endophyticus]UFS58003.1 SDR family NAD(P)-dependent oxidoreductase [Subtercola endophyticus]
MPISERVPTIVITGATSGLGRIAATELAQQGAHLVLTARSAERAEETRAEILAASPGSEIDVFLVDFTHTADVRRVGQEIARHYDQIDVLINNAGVHAFEQRITADGYPEMIAVNYLAPWLITRELLPTLTKTPGSRIVNVGSEASRRHGVLSLPGDLTDTAAFTARGSSLLYGKSKLLDIMFTLELARRIEGSGVTANVLDPGFNVTGLGRELGFAAPLERILTRLHIGDPRRGAGLIVKLATDPCFAGQNGGYYTVKKTERLIPIHPGNDTAWQARLWADTEHLLDEGRAAVDESPR